jgi:hypothetical protein
MIDNAVSGSPLPPIVQNLHSILLEQWQETWNILVAQFFAAPPQMMPAPAATRSEEAKSGQNTVEELGDLQDDWDGYGAASISREVRDNALHFIKVIEAAPFGMQAPEISPTPTGTISFEWATEVSVMRVDWIGANMCKRHAQALENIEQKKFYKGLAVLSAEQIRQSGASVVDSREVFEGHADIRHRIIAPAKGEPFSPPEKQKELYDRCSALADLANYYPDPHDSPHFTQRRNCQRRWVACRALRRTARSRAATGPPAWWG